MGSERKRSTVDGLACERGPLRAGVVNMQQMHDPPPATCITVLRDLVRRGGPDQRTMKQFLGKKERGTGEGLGLNPVLKADLVRARPKRTVNADLLKEQK